MSAVELAAPLQRPARHFAYATISRTCAPWDGPALAILLSDTAAENQVRGMLAALGSVSDSLTAISGNINRFAKSLDAPGGLGHTLTKDTAVVVQVKRVVANLDSSAYNLNEDLRALQRNWFFRKYFKEKERAKGR